MLMHHDSQPLYTWNSEAGLLNQVRQLRKAGAVHVQIMMLTPAPGSRSYEEAYSSGLAFQRVNGIPVEPRIVDGNHVVASRHPRPWTRQMNLLAAYFYFYNPLRLLVAMVCPKTKIPLVDAETSPPEAGKQRLARWKSFRRWARRRLRAHFADAAVQLFGMWALAHTASRTLGWCWRLLRGNIQRHTKAPVSPIPMRSVDGGPASHALPEITTAKQRPLRSKPKATIKTA